MGNVRTTWTSARAEAVRPRHDGRKGVRSGGAIACVYDLEVPVLLIQKANEVHFKAFDWTNVPAGSKFVDVGGGVGTVSKLLADSQSHFDIIIQDRPAVVADGLAVRFASAS